MRDLRSGLRWKTFALCALCALLGIAGGQDRPPAASPVAVAAAAGDGERPGGPAPLRAQAAAVRAPAIP